MGSRLAASRDQRPVREGVPPVPVPVAGLGGKLRMSRL
jgi:hypothetical protein